ncbi:histidine kinase [Lachnospiraceae bacterium 54-53]
MKINSIQTKMMSVSLFVAVGTVVASLLISYYTEVNVIKKTTEKYMEQYVAYADQNFNDMLNESKKVVLSIALAQDIISYNLVGPEEEAGYEAFQKKKQIKSFLSGFLWQKEYIEDIQLITRDGYAYQAGTELFFRKDLESQVMKRALSGRGMELLYEPEEKKLLLTRPVTYQNGAAEGVIAVHLNYDYIVNAYDIDPLNAMSIYLYLPDGQLLFSNAGEGMEDMGDMGKVKNADTGYIKWKGKRQYYIRYISKASKMTMISFIPQELLSKDAEGLKQKFLLIGIFASLAAILASSYLSKKICADIRSLSVGMDEVKSGNLGVRMNIRASDEIGSLAEMFNVMMERIEHLMEEVKHKEKMRWEAEQDVLASQIEPHFLYNSIGSMQYVAHMKGETEIEEVAKSLSSLLRSVLSNRNEFITLWEEKDYINDFITIERFKYGQFFEVIWDVDEELWTYPIPKLLLQPVVENALIHGLSSREEDGVINIKIYVQGPDVICKVLDNGKGMSEGRIRQLLEQVKDKERTVFRSIGIANVFQRIKLIYGETYGGTIYSSEGMFTCVELLLPWKGEK